METVTSTLRFKTITDLWQFMKRIGRVTSNVDLNTSEITGHFTKNELDIATKQMNGIVIHSNSDLNS